MKNFLVSLALFLATTSLTLADGPWAVLKHIPVPGDGGWDYLAVEPSMDRLFVTHADTVVVFQTETDKIVATLPSHGAHGVAWAEDLGRGFYTNGKAGTVTIFDLKTLAVISDVPAEKNPDAVCYEPVTHEVFAFNGRSGSATAIDGATGKVLSTIPLDGKPEFAAADGKGFIYDNLEDKAQIVKIDAVKGTIVARWSLPADCEPSALAIDPATKRLFVGCGDEKLRVVDGDSGQVLQTLPIGKGVDACTFAGGVLMASCGEGVLNIFEGKDFASVVNLPTQKGARTIAFNPVTRVAYLTTAQFGPAPSATPEMPHPRPAILPGTVEVLVVGKK
jgi:DNA-binding beta-propeller fold protein YncE